MFIVAAQKRDMNIWEALKAFCFISVSVLVFKKKQKQKRNRYMIMLWFCFGFVSVRLPFSHWLFRLSYPFYICLYSMIQLPGFCFVSVSFLSYKCTLGRNLKMAGICLSIDAFKFAKRCWWNNGTGNFIYLYITWKM